MILSLGLQLNFYLWFMASSLIELIMVLLGTFNVLTRKLENSFIMEIRLDLNMILLENMSVQMVAASILKEIVDKDVKLLDKCKFMPFKMDIIQNTQFSKSLVHCHSTNKQFKQILNRNDFCQFKVFIR